ncbi:MAG TPA: M90 family metallopeptidase, partial [Steroidobacteraceae bacterium]|nr:M90 family metallopeptidase [Steroidobacteraceae bacterium]
MVMMGIAFQPTLVALRRRALRARSFPEAWREILKRNVPYVRQLPADLQLQLKRHIQVFTAEKEFVGCGGFQINDEVKVTIAAQACLLLLNKRSDYFPDLQSILVYPDTFIVNRERIDITGVMHEQRQVLSGESWSQGKVILSWRDVMEGAIEVGDGRNVVIHEFAHQLDHYDGNANGFPFIADGKLRRRWTDVFSREFAHLQHQVVQRQPTLIDYYGATNPGEFFAVATETFFEQAPQLSEAHPAMYSV